MVDAHRTMNRCLDTGSYDLEQEDLWPDLMDGNATAG